MTATINGAPVNNPTIVCYKSSVILKADATPSVGLTTANGGVTVTATDITSSSSFKIGFGTTDDNRILRTYELKVNATNLIHYLKVPINVISTSGTNKVRAFIYKAANPAAIDTAANTIKMAYEAAGQWPMLGTGLREADFTVTTGINVLDISTLVADLLDTTAWASGQRLHVAIALKASDLNGSNYIEIDPRTTSADLEYSDYGSRVHQYVDISPSVPISFFPFDEKDATTPTILRAVTQRNDPQNTVKRHNRSVEVSPTIQVTGLEYTKPNAGRLIPKIDSTNGDGAFIAELIPTGVPDISKLHSEADQGGQIDPIAFVHNPDMYSIVQISSWVWDSTTLSANLNVTKPSNSYDYVGHRWDFLQNFGAMHWLGLTYSSGGAETKLRIVCKSGGVAPGSEAVLDQVVQKPNNGDVLEFVYLYSAPENKSYGLLRVKPTGSSVVAEYELIINSVPKLAYDPLSPYAPFYQIAGYAYNDQHCYGILNIATRDSSFSWDKVKRDARWACEQWQSGYKALPYGLWKDFREGVMDVLIGDFKIVAGDFGSGAVIGFSSSTGGFSIGSTIPAESDILGSRVINLMDITGTNTFQILLDKNQYVAKTIPADYFDKLELYNNSGVLLQTLSSEDATYTDVGNSAQWEFAGDLNMVSGQTYQFKFYKSASGSSSSGLLSSLTGSLLG